MYSIKTFKKTLLLMLLMAVIMPWKVNAQETLTVCDGSTTSTNAPIKNGGGSQSEFIYPATMLEDMDGGTISSIKFFSSTTSTSYSNTVTVFVEEVSETTEMTSAWRYNQSTATKVYEGTTLTVTNGEMMITFSTPFDYNGGNLCFNFWSASSTPSVSYYGVNPGYASCGYDYYITPPVNKPYNTAQFLPKAEFTFEAASVSCAKPKNFDATNITAHEATLTWTAGAEGQSNWDVFVTTDATVVPDENTEPTYQVTECSKTLSGLTGETTCYAYVRSVCGGTDGNSTWAKKVFTTTVACPVPTLTVLVDTRTAYSVDLQWTGNAAADQFEVAYSTTSNFDPNGTEANGVYHRTVEVTPASSHTWTLDGLNPETTYRMRVRANCGGDDGSSSWSGQKSVTTLPTCVAPSGLSATATATTITISWTAGATGQDAWDIRYKTGSDDYTYIHIDNQTETSYTIPNLSPATTYSVNVRAYCDAEDQSKWGYSTSQNYDLSVTTECAAITMPYTCDFEGAVETGGHFSNYPVPKCWDRVEFQYGSFNSSYYPYVYDYSSDAHGGTKSLRMLKNSNSADETIIFPEIDEQYEMSSLQIKFWAKTNSTNQTLQVGVMEGTTFVQVDEVTIANSTYAEYTVFFDGYNGTGRKIAIKCGSYQYMIYYYIDDLAVEAAPSCRLPKDLNATVDNDSQASLTWTAGNDETAWNLQYKKASDSNWSETIAVDETTYTLTGLQRATVYEARVQAICATDDQSDWTEPISFTTECGIWTIDAQNAIYEDFENVDASDFPPTCWQKFNYDMSGYTYWYLNSNNGLGSSAAFSYWSEGYAFLVMPQMHIDGDANLSFDYLIGSGNYNESCSVVVSTEGMTYGDFSQTIWAADGDNLPSGRASATISLSDYDEQDIYVAFKFKGSGTSGCTWYIDNVHVYVGEIFTKDITAYSGNGGYYLIASPIGEVNPEHVVNMLANNYDLYYFDQSATDGLEWINYRSNANAGGGFNLQPGKGYLYANSENTTLTFTGVPYNGNGQFDLSYDENASLKGWNLIGNPYPAIALLDNMSYYRLNPDGNALNATTENTPVAAMEGVFVQVTEANQKANFVVVTNNGEPSKVAKLNINVTQGRATSSATTLDNAIVRFDNGSTLGKFQLNPNHTKVYIPQGGKDYAIVRSATQGEMPVNFKAEKNGSYTLNVSAENMGMHYLHLIDNMTGADVDLLSDPSYSFEAKTSDYASRFRLVFEADDNGASTSSATFAYYNGNNWVISNPSTGSGSEATVQVIDVMGRILRSETLNGNAEINLNQPAGIYMLRLVNGENVKTQKIVVR